MIGTIIPCIYHPGYLPVIYSMIQQGQGNKVPDDSDNLNTAAQGAAPGRASEGPGLH